MRGCNEEEWRVKGCMRRRESEGMHEEEWRVKGCMKRRELAIRKFCELKSSI